MRQGPTAEAQAELPHCTRTEFEGPPHLPVRLQTLSARRQARKTLPPDYPPTCSLLPATAGMLGSLQQFLLLPSTVSAPKHRLQHLILLQGLWGRERGFLLVPSTAFQQQAERRSAFCPQRRGSAARAAASGGKAAAPAAAPAARPQPASLAAAQGELHPSALAEV